MSLDTSTSTLIFVGKIVRHHTNVTITFEQPSQTISCSLNFALSSLLLCLVFKLFTLWVAIPRLLESWCATNESGTNCYWIAHIFGALPMNSYNIQIFPPTTIWKLYLRNCCQCMLCQALIFPAIFNSSGHWIYEERNISAGCKYSCRHNPFWPV